MAEIVEHELMENVCNLKSFNLTFDPHISLWRHVLMDCAQLTLSIDMRFPCMLHRCIKNEGSLGGIRERETSWLVANLNRNMLRSWWHDLNFPLGSYNKDTACLAAFIVVSRSVLVSETKSDNYASVIVFVRYDQTLSCTELCPCQGGHLCQNSLTHQQKPYVD
jgi:hypothetical protein